MSDFAAIKKNLERWDHCDANARWGNYITVRDIRILIDIIEKQREAINELLANIELSHPEEYKQYRELPAVDEAYKLTEE